MTTATITRPAERLRCKCGTHLAPRRVTRDMGRAKSHRLRCPACGHESRTTFYLEKLTDVWNQEWSAPK